MVEVDTMTVAPDGKSMKVQQPRLQDLAHQLGEAAVRRRAHSSSRSKPRTQAAAWLFIRPGG